MTIEPYSPDLSDTMARCGVCLSGPVVVRKMAHGWVINLCSACLDRHSKGTAFHSIQYMKDQIDVQPEPGLAWP